MFYNLFRILGREFLKIFNVKLVKISLSERMLNILKANNQHKNIKFLQIGANDGVSFDCLYDYITKNKWSGVAVEPLKEFYDKLCFNYSGFSNIQLVNLAIHPTEKSISLYKVNPVYYNSFENWVKGIASFDKEHLIKHGVHESKIINETVDCINLMNLVKEYNLYDVDYIQIDTEGFDAEILKMLDFSLLKPQMIKFEHIHLNEIELNKVISLLKRNKYKFRKDKQDFFAYF